MWFFLIKLKVYGTRPRDPSTLEEGIRNACSSATLQILSDACQACVKQWLNCYKNGGAHVDEHAK